MAHSGLGDPVTCPRCGRRHIDRATTLCERCREALSQEGKGRSVTIELGPILARARASTGPGEDFDEALLRALKERHPLEAAGLLPAITRLVDVEVQRTGERREDVLRRLAEGGPSPTLTMRTSQGGTVSGSLLGSELQLGTSETTSHQTIIRIDGQEYHSLEEVPPHLRPMIERGMLSARRAGPWTGGESKRPSVRLGCSWALLAALLRAWRG